MSSPNREEFEISKMCHFTTSNMAIMDFEGLGTEYFEDETDRVFDLPIDPIWEGQQISTFTAWCNAHLRKVNMNIDCFEKDFRSGLRLMKLLEIISNELLPLPDKGKMRFHKIANVNKCLKFIEEKGVKLASIGAEEIVDGNVKMTLGMIWTIILRFTIQGILVEDSSAKDGLLLWCKRKTNGYKNITVENFKNSFQDGLVFCALLHNYDNSLLNYNSLNPSQSSHNLKLAFSVAEEHLDVPQMLNVDDMVNTKESDEKSIMTYVSSYYHAIEEKEKKNSALKTICKIISNEMEEKQCTIDYNSLSKNILKWMETWIFEFKDCPPFEDAKTLNEKTTNFKNYKFVEKPDKNKIKIQLQFLNVQKPNEKTKFYDCLTIQTKWNEMEKLEKEYETYLSEQRYRYDLIHNLLNKFETSFHVQRAWISDTIDLLLSKDFETANLQELQKLYRAQNTFISNLSSHKARTDKIIDYANELRRLDYKDMGKIDKNLHIIVSQWDTLDDLNSQRRDKIQMFLNALGEIDNLQLEFAKRVTPLYNWIQQAIQDLNDSFTFHLVAEIKDLIKAQQEFKSTVVEAFDELTYIESLNDRIRNIITVNGIQAIPLNPYTSIIIQDVQTAWICLERTIPERDKLLQDALSKEINYENCQDTFKTLSKTVFDNLVDIQNSLFHLVSTETVCSQILSKCTSLQKMLVKCVPQLKEVQIMNEKLLENKYDIHKAYYSFEQLNAIYEILEHLLRNICTSYKGLEAANYTNGSSSKTEDLKACFKHFDRSNSNQLDPNQFRACMLSLGYPLNRDGENDKQFRDIMNIVDSNNTGYVSLNSFLNFLTQKRGLEGTSEQLLESFKILANNENSISRKTIVEELPQSIAEYCVNNMPVNNTPSGNDECLLDYKSFSSKIFRTDSH